MTLERVELAFEEYRLEVAPPFKWRVHDAVFDSEGRPLKEVHATATVPIGGEWWWAGQARTDGEGRFQFLGPGSGYTIALSFQCPRDDDIIGRWVHVGAWGGTALSLTKMGGGTPAKTVRSRSRTGSGTARAWSSRFPRRGSR